MTRSPWLFGSAVFLGAFLLFLVEPISAKQLVPVLVALQPSGSHAWSSFKLHCWLPIYALTG